MHMTVLRKVGGSVMQAIPLALQPHAIDLAARGGRLVERAPSVVMDEVLARLGAIFS